MDYPHGMQLDDIKENEAASAQETAKRRQILDGARSVFLSHGYDGASMDMIAKTAGVSKGTLYVYFPNKEALFRELILKDRTKQAESFIDCASKDGNLRDQLNKIGCVYVDQMLGAERLSTIRMVLGATEKFPEFGNLLYDAGPKKGMETFGRFLAHRVKIGDLNCPDPELAACQFMELCAARVGKRIMFHPGETARKKEIEANVASAVHMFLSAYGTEKSLNS